MSEKAENHDGSDHASSLELGPVQPMVVLERSLFRNAVGGRSLLFFAGTSSVVLVAYFVVSSEERSLAPGAVRPGAAMGAALFLFS
jgi:hypothetical protein